MVGHVSRKDGGVGHITVCLNLYHEYMKFVYLM